MEIKKELKAVDGRRYGHKGLYLWLLLGIVIYSVFTFGFMLLSEQYTRHLNIDSLEVSEIQREGNTFTTLKNWGGTGIYIQGDKKYNYICMELGTVDKPSVNIRLHSSDRLEGIENASYKELYLTAGKNRLKPDSGSCFYIEIYDSSKPVFTLDEVSLRMSDLPVYALPQSALFFAFIWLGLYFVGRYAGIRCNNIAGSLVTLAEGMFALLMIMILIFAADTDFNSILMPLLPPAVLALAVLYARHACAGVRARIFIPVVFAVMLAVMVYVGHSMLSVIQTDLGTVYYSAWEAAKDGKVSTEITGMEAYRFFMESSNNDYFVRYPNNIPLLALLKTFYGLLKHFSLDAGDELSNFMSVLLNIVFIMAGVGFGILAAKNFFGKKGAVIYTVMAALFVPYYINACRFYTDTFSLPFVSAAIWAYSLAEKERTVPLKGGILSKIKSSPYTAYALMGVFIAAGALIKGSVAVIAVAAVIQLLLKSLKNVKFAAVMAAALVAVSCVWSAYEGSISWLDTSQKDRYAFPVTHWIMMSLDTSVKGKYSQSDFEYTDKYTSKAKKQKADIRRIKERLAGFGSVGELADYELERAAALWCNGSYMQDNHIAWGIEKGAIYDVLTPGREYYPVYKVYALLYVFCMYIFAAAGALAALKAPKADSAMFLRLTMLGAMLFFAMWENNPRYLLNFTPVFMLAAIWGLEAIKDRYISKPGHPIKSEI